MSLNILIKAKKKQFGSPADKNLSAIQLDERSNIEKLAPPSFDPGTSGL